LCSASVRQSGGNGQIVLGIGYRRVAGTGVFVDVGRLQHAAYPLLRMTTVDALQRFDGTETSYRLNDLDDLIRPCEASRILNEERIWVQRRQQHVQELQLGSDRTRRLADYTVSAEAKFPPDMKPRWRGSF